MVDKDFKTKYIECLNDYIAQGHMSKIEYLTQTDAFYLPHHAVMKEASETTKCRIVFDGSCTPDHGISINALQYVGPTLQRELFSIILRFRIHMYVITADITQMYRQIWLHPEHRKFQRIIWRDEPEKPFQCYQLNTLTFGMTSSPYLAIRCLMEAAKLNQSDFPIESQIIINDFYVDDILTGANNINDLQTIKENLVKILAVVGLVLTKFKSNIPDLSDKVGANSCLIASNTTKTLGIRWNPERDTFSYQMVKTKESYQVTKRTILSTISKLFDPIGLLAPIIVIAKIILQELWQLNLDWDESIPCNLNSQWLAFLDDLKVISQIKIPRFVFEPNSKIFEIHGFADASERAYGACIYVKSVNDDGDCQIHLLAAKSRVAPIKIVSLPRLELLAAVLLVQLMTKVKNILNINFQQEYYWTDSKIVLNWLQAHPTKWATFVANRVSFIQNSTNPNNWFHVKSADNPADVISRGMLPSQLIHSTLWWQGPHWLKETQFPPKSKIIIQFENLPEHKKSQKALLALNLESEFLFKKYSNLNKLKRIVAWCLRFKTNCLLSKPDRSYKELNVNEINNAFNYLLRLSQMESFPSEYNDLSKNRSINKMSTILSLTPVMDEHSLIRVGGRLKNSEFLYDKKHPVLLHNKHYLTKLILEAEHVRLSHAAPTLLLSNVRETFWPISGKTLARKIVRACMKCFRFNPKIINPLLGELPKHRVESVHAFHSVGIDYAGPFSIRQGKGSKLAKGYIALFVCFATKALHLELVTALSTDAFIAAFRRFVARRGKPTHVYSDNATNFQCANKELKQLYEFLKTDISHISRKVSEEGVTWHFIPARSPHFGGLWEAGVKSIKYHLKRILSDVPLTFEEFYTVLTQIESILNSRPLSPLSDDPNDNQPLTPAHLLIGRMYTTLPDPNMLDLKINSLSRYQLLQRLAQQFWQRWHKEYISQLQQRTKWKGRTTNLQVGTLVLLKEDNVPPANWRLGRILEVHPGRDDIVRVVTVKCSGSVFKRSVVKVCALPISDSTS